MTHGLYGDLFEPGALLGSYVVEQLASQGGFASVYRATHVDTGEAAAVKVLHRTLSRSAKMLARFEREAAVIRQLRHPHIVELFEVGELSCGRPFLAMEWLDGRNLLDELAARGPFAVAEAAAVMEEVGGALAAAHAAGVVHRDVKAQNVMALPDGDWFRCKLVDFGIAKVRTPAGMASLTSQTILGTPRTAAPEQIVGEAVDARTDVYGLGILLFQLLTGRLPFVADSAIELEEMHLFLAPPLPSEVAPVSRALDPVVVRALEKQPEHRFASVADLLLAMRAASRSESGEGRRLARPAVGLWIEVMLPDAGVTDELLDRADDLLLEVEDRAASAGLTVQLTTPTTILATADADSADRVRELADDVAARGRAATLPLRVAVQRGELELVDDGSRAVGGDLLTPTAWAADSFLVAAE